MFLCFALFLAVLSKEGVPFFLFLQIQCIYRQKFIVAEWTSVGKGWQDENLSAYKKPGADDL